MSTAMKAIAFYPSHHPSVVSSLERAAQSLKEGLGIVPEVRVVVSDQAFLLAGEPLAAEDRTLRGFATYLSRRGVGGLAFRSPIERDSLRGLLEVIAMDPATLKSLGGPARNLARRKIEGVAIQEFDPAALLKSARTATGAAVDEAQTSGPGGSWSDRLVRYLLGQQTAPPAGGVHLLRRIAGDETAARELMASLQSATKGAGAERGRLLTSALTRTAAEVAASEPEAFASLAANLSLAFEELDPAARLELLNASMPIPGADLDLGRALRSSLPDDQIGELIVSLVRSEGKITRRLTSVVRKVLIDSPNPEHRRESMQKAIRETRQPGDAAMADVWASIESLVEESEDAWISIEYKGFLEILGVEPPRLEEGLREEMRERPGFMEALTEPGIRRRAWALFADLLGIESEPARLWVALDQIERRVQAIDPSWFPDCAAVVTAVRGLLEGGPAPEAFVREAGVKAIQAIASRTVGAYRAHFHGLAASQKEQVAAALEALGPRAVEPLIAGLEQEEDWEIRKTFIAFLIARGREAVPTLVRYLSAPSWYLVRNVLVILGEIGDPSTVPPIAGSLKHPEPRVRRDAVAALGKIGGPRAFALIRERLGDPEVGDVATRCLATIDRPRTVATFLEMTDAPSLLGRHNARLREAITALGALGAHESVPRLRSILMRGLWLPPSAGDTVRIAAARALEKIGTLDARKALETGARLWRRPVRLVCAEIVGGRQPAPH